MPLTLSREHLRAAQDKCFHPVIEWFLTEHNTPLSMICVAMHVGKEYGVVSMFFVKLF